MSSKRSFLRKQRHGEVARKIRANLRRNANPRHQKRDFGFSKLMKMLLNRKRR